MALSVKSSKLSKRTHKIIFLGDAGVGKTSLIERFANNKFEEGYNVRMHIRSQQSESISLGKT